MTKKGINGLRGYKNKKAQSMSLPFTMIFAIIMVAVILFVGFYVITMFLDRAEQVKLNTLPKDIEETVIQAWQSSQTERTINLDSSNKVQQICFIDFSQSPKGDYTLYNDLKNFDEEANFFYYPLMKAEKYSSFTAWQIKCGTKDCLKVELKNPLCIEVIDGKVTFKLKKESGQSYVTINSP